MDAQVLFEPTFAPKSQDLTYDVIVVGAGPGGLSAALACGRARLKTLVIERALSGGQVSTAYTIRNVLGYPGGILGSDLAARMQDHLGDYALDYVYATVEDVAILNDGSKQVRTDMNAVYLAKTVILAVGLEPKKLNTHFEDQFLGRGLSYYAQSDWQKYKGKNVAVIGGGNCACYATDFLSEFAKHVTMIHQQDHLKAVVSLREKIAQKANVTVLWQSTVTDVFGIDHVEKIKCQHVITHQSTWIDVQGLFIYAGRIPPKEIFHLALTLDEKGYIVTDDYMRTSLKGVYAVGDIRSKQIRQIVTAMSDGMIAAINAEREIRG